MPPVQGAKLIIFDLDGTLIDSFGDIRSCLTGAFDEIGHQANEEVMELIRAGASLEAFYEQAMGQPAAANAEQFSQLVEAYRRRYANESLNRPFAGARELLEELRQRRPSLKLGVATAKRSEMAERVLLHSGLRGLFDVARGTDELPHKPDPALLFAVCKKAEVAPQDALMIGDTDKDMLAARAAGLGSIGICHGGWGRAQLSTLGPDHIVDDFGDLRRLLFES